MRENASSVARGSTPLKTRRKRPAQPDLNFGHAQQVSRAMAHPFQIDIVDADHLAAVNVDDLAVDQVLLQVDIVALVLERHEGTGGAQFQRAGRRLHHFLRGHDAQTGTRLEHQAGHLAGIRAGGHGDVFEPPRRCPCESVTGVPSSAVRLTRAVVRGWCMRKV